MRNMRAVAFFSLALDYDSFTYVGAWNSQGSKAVKGFMINPAVGTKVCVNGATSGDTDSQRSLAAISANACSRRRLSRA